MVCSICIHVFICSSVLQGVGAGVLKSPCITYNGFYLVGAQGMYVRYC